MLKLDKHERSFPFLSRAVVWAEEREREMEIRRFKCGPSNLALDLPDLTVEVAHALNHLI